MIFNPFKFIRAHLAYRRAVLMADQLFAGTKQRQYVIQGAHRKLLVVDRANFRVLKRKGYIKQAANVLDLTQNCYYCTSYGNGSEPMPDIVRRTKKQHCIKWLCSKPIDRSKKENK